jgi:hypothetical protein
VLVVALVALDAELETKFKGLRLEYEDMMPRLSFGYNIKRIG